jgi:hypothetical protein
MKSVRRAATGAAVAALAVAGPAVPSASAQGARAAIGSASARCVGSEHLCGVSFSLVGGASNKRLTVNLPGTNMHVLNTFAIPLSLRGAYRLSAPRFSLGGSVYSVTLNAVRAIRVGRVAFVFGDPTTTRRCPDPPGAVSSLSVGIVITGYFRPAFSCTQAGGVAAAFTTRFNQHMSVATLMANGRIYHCRLVPRVPQNYACVGSGTVVRFAGPTG